MQATPLFRQSAVRIGLLALGLGLTQAGHAVTIFNNGAPDQIYGVNMHANVVAEDFTLASTTDITNLRFWSIQSALADYTGTVAWAIYSNVASAPGVSLANGTASIVGNLTGLSTGFGYAEYVFDIAVTEQLTAGTYWLGLNSSPLNNGAPNEMLWETTSTVTGSQAKYLDGTWIGSGSDLAFRIDGTVTAVPEPSGWALAVLALAGAGLARRRA